MSAETRPWNVQDSLKSPADIAAYANAAIKDGDPKLLAAALADIAQAVVAMIPDFRTVKLDEREDGGPAHD
jgi:DNA-binding phage protein